MGLLKRLLGDTGPSQDELQRQADEEIKQMLSASSSGPQQDKMPGEMTAEEPAKQEQAAG